MPSDAVNFYLNIYAILVDTFLTAVPWARYREGHTSIPQTRLWREL